MGGNDYLSPHGIERSVLVPLIAAHRAAAITTRPDPALTRAVVPAVGWVRVNAAVTGIPAGQQCRLIVLGRDGSRQLAGSWLVSTAGATTMATGS